MDEGHLHAWSRVLEQNLTVWGRQWDAAAAKSFLLLLLLLLSRFSVSDSVRPHRRQPTRLPHPWDSPGKNTGVGCHFLLQGMKVKRESEVAQSCPTLRDPMDCSLPGPSVHGVFQARVLEWGAIAFSVWKEQYLHILFGILQKDFTLSHFYFFFIFLRWIFFFFFLLWWVFIAVHGFL